MSEHIMVQQDAVTYKSEDGWEMQKQKYTRKWLLTNNVKGFFDVHANRNFLARKHNLKLEHKNGNA